MTSWNKQVNPELFLRNCDYLAKGNLPIGPTHKMSKIVQFCSSTFEPGHSKLYVQYDPAEKLHWTLKEKIFNFLIELLNSRAMNSKNFEVFLDQWVFLNLCNFTLIVQIERDPSSRKKLIRIRRAKQSFIISKIQTKIFQKIASLWRSDWDWYLVGS